MENKNKKFQKIVRTNSNYIDKFCEMAEREASFLDEWGDENLDSLPILEKECMVRIAKREFADYKLISSKLDYLIDKWFDADKQNPLKVRINNKAPDWALEMFNVYLPEEFQKYHRKRKMNPSTAPIDINKMSGVEFENYVANLLKLDGYNVSGTPATGDQGGDLIASKDNKVNIIQVKRYSGVVGNKAVQEVVAAKNYYNGDAAVVVTNSSFTISAKSLAKRNNVILIDKTSLQTISSRLNIY